MTHQFTVGEYKTKGDFNAVVLEVGPDDTLFGREQRDVGSYWYAKRWAANGKNKVYQVYGESDLVPPKQEIWIASWVNKLGGIGTDWLRNKNDAIIMATCSGRIKIAVTGPHEVPA